MMRRLTSSPKPRSRPGLHQFGVGSRLPAGGTVRRMHSVEAGQVGGRLARRDRGSTRPARARGGAARSRGPRRPRRSAARRRRRRGAFAVGGGRRRRASGMMPTFRPRGRPSAPRRRPRRGTGIGASMLVESNGRCRWPRRQQRGVEDGARHRPVVVEAAGEGDEAVPGHQPVGGPCPDQAGEGVATGSSRRCRCRSPTGPRPRLRPWLTIRGCSCWGPLGVQGFAGDAVGRSSRSTSPS